MFAYLSAPFKKNKNGELNGRWKVIPPLSFVSVYPTHCLAVKPCKKDIPLYCTCHGPLPFVYCISAVCLSCNTRMRYFPWTISLLRSISILSTSVKQNRDNTLLTSSTTRAPDAIDDGGMVEFIGKNDILYKRYITFSGFCLHFVNLSNLH